MEIIFNSAWELASHPLVQAPVIQAIGLGSFLLRNGLHTGCRAFKDDAALANRVLKGALGILLSGAGGYLFREGAVPIWNAGFERSYSAFFPTNKEPEPRKELHPFEESLAQRFGDSFLHLNMTDPLPKLLWLTAEHDYNGALDPSTSTSQYYAWRRIHNLLENRMDIKYQVIASPKQMCEAVQSALKIGDLVTLVLDGHGNNGAFTFSKNIRMNILKPLPDDCFAGMRQDAKIMLSSCYGGSRLVPLNIAEWISWISGKTVYAPRHVTAIDQTELKVLDHGELIMDFCSTEGEVCDYLDDQFQCQESITSVFHPPKSFSEQGYYTVKIGLSALSGVFIGSELIRLTLAIPILLARTLFK